MADKDKDGPFKPLQFTAPPPATKPPTATVSTVTRPEDMEQVPRPDVPDTREAPPATAADTFFGGVAGFLDNIVPDDMGGLVSGKTGWLNAIPGYETTTGVAFETFTGGFSRLIEGMYWGSEQMDHLGAAAVSALPGGMPTLTWDQAHRISYGQATATNAGYLVREGLQDGDLSLMDVGQVLAFGGGPTGEGVKALGAYWMRQAQGDMATNDPELMVAQNNPVYTKDDFNPWADPRPPMRNTDRDAFSRDVSMQVGTGFADAMWDVVADPTTLLGATSTVLRSGAKALNFAGLTRSSLARATFVRDFGQRIDDGVQWAATGGKEGRWTPQAEHLADLISKPADQLSKNVFVASSSRPDDVIKLAVQVPSDDLATGAALVKAMAGDPSGWRALRTRSATLYDQMASMHGFDPLAPLPGRTSLTPDQVRYGNQLADEFKKAEQLGTPVAPHVAAVIAKGELNFGDDWVTAVDMAVERLTEGARVDGVLPDEFALSADRVMGEARTILDEVGISPAGLADDAAKPIMDDATGLADDAVEVVDDLPIVAPGGQLITRGGNRVSARMARWANAYRQGATMYQFGRGHVGTRITVEGPEFSGSQWVSTILEHAAGNRVMRSLRWLGAETPAGIVHLKGGDGNTANREVAAFLRKSEIKPDDSARLFRLWVDAKTPEQKLKALEAVEEAEVAAVAAKHNMAPAVAYELYRSYASKRRDHIASLRESRKGGGTGFAVDENGEMVTVAGLYTDLDQAFPMLDQDIFHTVVKGNARAMRTVEDVVRIADTVNTWWKLGVLMRLGYTQRNLTEGILRSVMSIGYLAAHPQAFASLPANAVWYMGARSLRGKMNRQRRAINLAYENVAQARRAYAESIRVGKVAEGDALLAKAESLQAKLASFRALPSRTADQDATVTRLQKELDDLNAKYAQIKADFIDPNADAIAARLREQDRALRDLSDIADSLDDTIRRMQARNSKRRKTGNDPNVMDDGAEMAGAFEGPEGRIARLLAAADRTVYMTFDAAFEKRKQGLDSQVKYVAYDPRSMKPGEAELYWDEYAVRLNQRWGQDQMIRMWLDMDAAGSTNFTEQAIEWLMSDAGKFYREALSLKGQTGGGRNLLTKAGKPDRDAITKYVTEQYGYFKTEIPAFGGLRAMVRRGDVLPGEIASAYAKGGMEPPRIPVRPNLPSESVNTFRWVYDKTHGAASTLMKWLGTVPETVVLRHPFYDSVYKQRQSELYTMAREMGQDVSDPTLLKRINRAAHDDALAATKNTMYTIERLSNTAELVRWFMPFFPAFENAIRVWGRMVYRNPAIIPIMDHLWNIPESLGMVYDKNGNRVDHSNFFKDEGHVIVWPEVIQQGVMDFMDSLPAPVQMVAGQFGLNPGAMFGERKQGYNVVLPGAEWWFPGVGPAAQTPIALLLRGKPELNDLLQANMSEEMYKSIVPQGDPNTDLIDIWFPTIARRINDTVFNGTNEASAYLTLQKTMIEDAYIDAQIDGRVMTRSEVKGVLEEAQDFWNFTIRAAATDFNSGKRYVSPYEMYRREWRKLLDDQSLTWQQKIDTFKTLYGTEFLAVTRSGSESEYGIAPTLSAWQKINSNEDLMRELSELGPEVVGMYANIGSFDDPFSFSTYSELGNLTIGTDGKPVRSQRDPYSLWRNNQVMDGWDQWRGITEVLDDKAAKLGKDSYRHVPALVEIANREKSLLANQYPEWGKEKDFYEESWPRALAGARVLVANTGVIGEDSTLRVLAQYVELRDMIAERKSLTDDADLRRQLNEIAWKAVADMRNSDIGFADLYDRYLADDDFRVVR